MAFAVTAVSLLIANCVHDCASRIKQCLNRYKPVSERVNTIVRRGVPCVEISGLKAPSANDL